MARSEMFGFSRSPQSLAFLLLVVAELCCFGMTIDVSPSAGREARQFYHPLHAIDEPIFPDSARQLQGNVVDEIIAMITAQQYAGLEALQAAYSGQGSNKGQYFGITNVFGAGSQNQQQCSNTTCPVCSTCTCPSKVAAPTINVILGAQDCITASSAPSCSQVSIAKAGTLSITFKDSYSSVGQQGPLFSMGIIATCPSTQIKLTCSSISPSVVVTTSSTQSNGPVSPNTSIYDYSGSLRIAISQQPFVVSDPGSAICTWETS